MDDLKAIVTYLARDQGNRAYSIADRIRKSGDDLQTFATGHAGRVAGTYEKPVPDLPYFLAYAIDDKAGCIVVLRVIHSARHWPEGA